MHWLGMLERPGTQADAADEKHHPATMMASGTDAADINISEHLIWTLMQEAHSHRGVARLRAGLLRLAALGLSPGSLRGAGGAGLGVDLRHRRVGIRRVQAHHFLHRREGHTVQKLLGADPVGTRRAQAARISTGSLLAAGGCGWVRNDAGYDMPCTPGATGRG